MNSVTSPVYFYTKHVSHDFPNLIVFCYNIKINFLKYPLFNSCHLKVSFSQPFSYPSSGFSPSGNLPWHCISYPVMSTKFPVLNLELLNTPHSDGPYLTQDPSFNSLQRSTTYYSCHMNSTVRICGVFSEATKVAMVSKLLGSFFLSVYGISIPALWCSVKVAECFT